MLSNQFTSLDLPCPAIAGETDGSSRNESGGAEGRQAASLSEVRNVAQALELAGMDRKHMKYGVHRLESRCVWGTLGKGMAHLVFVLVVCGDCSLLA